MDRLIDCSGMTLAVYLGCKTTAQQQQQNANLTTVIFGALLQIYTTIDKHVINGLLSCIYFSLPKTQEKES